MNNYIFDYLEDMHNKNARFNLSQLSEIYNFCLVEIPENELLEFPKEHLPNPNKVNFIFTLTDGPESQEANYFIDYDDYSPDCDFIYPFEGKKRLNIFIDILYAMIDKTASSRL